MVEKSDRKQHSPTSINQSSLSNLLCGERLITFDEACALRILLFGQTSQSFKFGWTQQGFKFRNKPPYGLQQNKVGPCGLIAAVQAHVLYELLFGYSRTVLDFGFLKPRNDERKEALARALASILWKAGEYTEAVVAVRSDTLQFPEHVTSNVLTKDGLLEYVILKYFKALDSLLEYLYNCIQTMTKEDGCILFMYSLLFTHGIDKTKQEMDESSSRLIGDDGFCSQELVNLILTGEAVSNIFDGNIEFNSENGETSIHRGISKQSKIGLLSVYDYQLNDTTRTNFKDPEYPIWVIYGRLHFTVLFGTSRNVLSNTSEPFKLFYYDSIASHHAEKSYVVKPNARFVEAERDNSLPVQVRCILIRYPLAEIQTVETDDTET